MMTPRTASLAVIAGLLLAAGAASGPARAQGQNQAAPPEVGLEVGNLGSIPFVAQPTLLLRAEDKAKVRQLEDRQLQERRALEDRYDQELRQVMLRQASEREALLRSFAR
jgi:hypothetical protein